MSNAKARQRRRWRWARGYRAVFGVWPYQWSTQWTEGGKVVVQRGHYWPAHWALSEEIEGVGFVVVSREGVETGVGGGQAP